MELIKPEDPQYFTHTSDDLYDRHHYKIVSNSGETITVDNWEDAKVVWWNKNCLLYTSPSPRDATLSRMPSSA